MTQASRASSASSASVSSSASSVGPAFDCPHATRCAGCPALHLPYPEQLRAKTQRVRIALSEYRELQALGVPEAWAAEPQLEYRVRAKLVVDGAAVGLYAGGAATSPRQSESGRSESHEVVDIPGCRVLRPRVQRVVATLRAGLPLDFRLLAIDVREADAGVLLTLIVPPETDERRVRAAAERLMHDEPMILGVSLAERAPRAATVLGSAPRPLIGLAKAPHHLDAQGPFHEAVPGGFVQAHAGQATRLHGWVADQLQRLRGSLKDCQILELYAGAAAMGLALAARGARVTAVDQYAPSLAQAKRAASAQGLSLDTRAEPAEQALSLVQTQNYEAVIVDPPRRGLSPAVREAMGGAAARWFVYVSCEPTTLARDLAHLARLGLRVEQLAPLDMIPHSESVETAVLLVRGAPVPPEVLYRDGCLLAIDKPAFLSLHHRQGGQPSLLDRVRSLDGFETAVPLDSEPLDTAASGVCWFLARPELLTQFSHAWQARDEHWSVLAQGVLRGKGRLGPFTYRRERVVGTHSLLSVSCLHEAADARSASGQAPRARRERTRPIGSYLKPIRHPLLGDERFGNPAANRYFIERHGLDRPFLHRRLVSWRPYGEAALEVSCEIPAELRQVLESLSAETGAAPGD